MVKQLLQGILTLLVSYVVILIILIVLGLVAPQAFGGEPNYASWVNNNATNKHVRPDRMAQFLRARFSVYTNTTRFEYVNVLDAQDKRVHIVSTPYDAGTNFADWPIVAVVDGTNQFPKVPIAHVSPAQSYVVELRYIK